MNENQVDNAAENVSAGGKGTMIGTIIVIIILVIGAVYLFMGQAEAPANPEVPAGDAAAEQTDNTTGSDEIADIEADLNVVDQSVDEQVNAIDQSLGE